MCECQYFYNVNKIIVDECDQKRYVKFSKKLNSCLQCNYGEYYVGLQLYQTNQNCFIVVAKYYNACGLMQMMPCISEYIEEQYDECFGSEVKRISILAFNRSCRISC